MTRIHFLCGVLRGSMLLGLSLWATTAQSARLNLEMSSALVEEGAVVELAVYGSEFMNGTDGGDFSLSWSGNLTFVGLTVHASPWDLSSFDESEVANAYIHYVDVFSSVATPGVGGGDFAVATLTLRATDLGAAFVVLSSNLVGWSLAGESLDYTLPPALVFEVVPEPGTGSVLGLFGVLLARVGPRQRSRGRVAT